MSLISETDRPPAETEIVYVCTPDWRSRLSISLCTLLQSGTTFDRVTVFSVSDMAVPWDLPNGRVQVVHVAPLDGNTLSTADCFLPNKIYMCRGNARRVVYLDADTLVQHPLDLVWNTRPQTHVLARTASRAEMKGWNAGLWQNTLQRFGARGAYRYLNSGFVVFQNGAHRTIECHWLKAMQTLSHEPELLQKLHAPQYLEQLSLSLAIGAAHLSWALMSPQEHAYAWRFESNNAARVCHLSGVDYGNFDSITAEHQLRGLLAAEARRPKNE